eukprot:c20562_g1_i1 orf=44-196(+)
MHSQEGQVGSAVCSHPLAYAFKGMQMIPNKLWAAFEKGVEQEDGEKMSST